MAKDHIRDYATSAFRFYAKYGSSNNYIKTITEDMQKQKGNGICNPTESALIHKEIILKEKAAELADLDAVEKVLWLIDKSYNGAHIRKAIEYVYFSNCWRDLKKGDIENGVHLAELNIPASRCQVYRWLAKARLIFAEERGLRIN